MKTYKLIFIALLLIGLCVSSVSAATYLSQYDPYKRLSIHYNATPFTDDTGKTITNNGVTLNTTVKYLGAGSGNFSGLSNMTIPDSDDWYFADGNVTLGGWYYFTNNATPKSLELMAQVQDPNNVWSLYYTPSSHTTSFYSYAGGYQVYASTTAFVPMNNTWYQIYYQNSTLGTQKIYVNGVPQTLTTNTTGAFTNFAGALQIGSDFSQPAGDNYYRFQGLQDSVNIWNCVIPISELYPQIYEVGQTIPANPIFSGFSLFNAAGTAPHTTYLYDQSTNLTGSETFGWDLGDGNTSTEKNLYFTWNVTGEYTVNHSVSNGVTTSYSQANVTVGTPTPPVVAPVASFYGSPTTGNVPLSVFFTDVSSNTPTSWNWSFGDGLYSELQNPSHTYTRSGFKTVSLTATNSAGSNVTVRLKFVRVS